MDEEFEKKIGERISELPQDIRNAIDSVDLDLFIQQVGTNHALHIDQIGALQDETLMVMLGFSKPEEFVQNLTNKLRVAPDVAANIAGEVSQKVFLPIRESMKAFSEQRAHVSRAVHSDVAPVAPSTAISTTPPPQTTSPGDFALSEKTVTVAPAPGALPATPPPPGPYKADPYREPV